MTDRRPLNEARLAAKTLLSHQILAIVAAYGLVTDQRKFTFFWVVSLKRAL